jgi:hypothetical protein
MFCSNWCWFRNCNTLQYKQHTCRGRVSLHVILLECLFYIHGVHSLARLRLLTKAASRCPYSSSKTM